MVKKKIGRPRKPESEKVIGMKIWIRPNQLKLIDELAALMHVSRNAAFRWMIDTYVKRADRTFEDSYDI